MFKKLISQVALMKEPKQLQKKEPEDRIIVPAPVG